MRRCSEPLSVTFLKLEQLRSIHKRERDPLQTTEFAFTRFLVPHLCGYEGSAIFADGDMLCMADLAKLWALRDPRMAVQVVQHEQDGMGERISKFLGRPQTPYARKNWSSLMLFNNGACRTLTPEYVDTARGLKLHQFAWTADQQIGALPAEWNHLVSVKPSNPSAKIAHFTLGMPMLHAGKDCEFGDDWRDELRAMERHVCMTLDTLYAVRNAAVAA